MRMRKWLVAALLFGAITAVQAADLEDFKARLEALDCKVLKLDRQRQAIVARTEHGMPLLFVIRSIGARGVHTNAYVWVSYYEVSDYARRHPQELARFINDIEQRITALAYIDKDGDLRIEWTQLGGLDDLGMFLLAFAFFTDNLDKVEAHPLFDRLLKRPNGESLL